MLYEHNTAIVVPSTDAMHRVKQLTGNQMFGSRQTTGPSPRSKSLPIYISWYINGYGHHGRPQTRKMRPDYERVCT